MADEVEWTVLRAEQPARIVLRGLARVGFECDLTYWFHATGTRTAITVSVVLAGSSISKSVADFVEMHCRQQLDRSLGQLGALADALYSS